MFRTILLPIDFSEPSARAARFAVAIALHTGSLIRAITVEPPNKTDDNHSTLLREFVQDAATSITSVSTNNSGNAVQFEFESKSNDLISQSILESASAEDVDIVIMGTHGRSGLSALLLGSVTEQVIREIRKPILAVGVGDEITLADGRPPHNILVAIDFTETSLAALRQAVKLAEIWQSRLLLLHSVEVTMTVPFAPINSGPIIAAETELINQAHLSLTDLAHHEIGDSIEFELIVTEGEPTNQIIKTIIDRVVDLVIVGPHKYKKLERLLLGSTTERLLHKCPAPIWVHQQMMYPPVK